jgi:glycosidase
MFGMSLIRRAADSPRPVIYQLLVRTFGNTNETRKVHGTMAENGCGKFADITPVALESLRDMGFTHLWLTGILEQASGTSYPRMPADDPDILKGIAGSPYAIRDYFDVCPDYAIDPDKRLEEFKALIARCHAHRFKVIIDFVPNHVARSYVSDVRPELSFGEGDKTDVFFDRDNHFYYLDPYHPGGGPPLHLPMEGQSGCDGLFERETTIGRVTGNNSVTWRPSAHDWYETVKLNYGHDFTRGRDTRHLPGSTANPQDVPRTWRVMDEVLAHWQAMGVDGFRADMAHMVPMEFWRWVVRRCRARDPDVFLTAEAYDNDPAKLTNGHVLDELLHAGFDAVYDDPVYDVLEGIYDGGKWANDLDAFLFTGPRFDRSLRYTENHDEVRLANSKVWGGHGMKVGRPATAVLFGMGQGPLMMYHGQEIGETAEGVQGFAGDNARTTIFDYWSMPEFTKWVNGGKYDGGRLTAEQKELREWYAALLRVTRERAFTQGGFYGLNHANKDNPHGGRANDESTSGHWIYSYLRRDPKSGQAFLVVANFHPSYHLAGVRIRIPEDAQMFLGRSSDAVLKFTDRLATAWSQRIERVRLADPGLALPDLPPCSAMMLEIMRG